MKRLALTLIVMCIGYSTALAAYVDGYQLASDWKIYQNRDDRNGTREGWYWLGYVIGVADTLDESGIISVPANAKQAQIGAIVGKYLDDHPAEWNQPATVLIMNALKVAFPVAKTAPKNDPSDPFSK